MDFLHHKNEIEKLVKKIDKDGYECGNSCIGDLTIELLTSDEVY